MHKTIKLIFLTVLLLQKSLLFANKDTMNAYYSDTSYTHKILTILSTKYNNIKGTLEYDMVMKQYDSSLTFLLDSSKSLVKYSGKEYSMKQNDDIMLIHDTIMLYLNKVKKEMYLQVRKKTNADNSFAMNPMGFLLKFYKERKFVIRKLSENELNYTYSVDFDEDKSMYIVTADKKTDYITKVDINYFVPDASNLVSSRRLIVNYSKYNFSKNYNDNELFKYVSMEMENNYKPIGNFKDYKINIYGN
jgi:hypothetical protein